MDKKYKFIIGILIILFIALSVSLLYYFYNLNIIRGDLNQAEVLKNICLEFLNEKYVNITDSTVYFEEGSLRNFITNSKFDNDCRNLLKTIETNGNDVNDSYKIKVQYIPKSHILFITLQNENGNYKLNQKYRIFVKNGEIMYEKCGEPEEVVLIY